MSDAKIEFYAALIGTALTTGNEADIDAVDAYEAAHPEVIDAIYQAYQPKKGQYDPVAQKIVS